MKKLLIRLLLPSAEDITTLATKTIVDFINNSGKGDVIAKYGSAADEFTKVQAKITSWLKDGKIDEQEKAELYNALLPLADKLLKEVSK